MERLKLDCRYTKKTASTGQSRHAGTAIRAVGGYSRSQLKWLLTFAQRNDLGSLTDPELTSAIQEALAFHAARGGYGGGSELPATALERLALLVRADVSALKSGNPATAHLHGAIARTASVNPENGKVEATLSGNFEPVWRWLAFDLVIALAGNIGRCMRAECGRFFLKSKGQKFHAEACSQLYRTARYRTGYTLPA